MTYGTYTTNPDLPNLPRRIKVGDRVEGSGRIHPSWRGLVLEIEGEKVIVLWDVGSWKHQVYADQLRPLDILDLLSEV